MKADGLSVDIGQVLVVPIEVATAVDPVLGAGVRVGAHLEPPGKTHKHKANVCRYTLLTKGQQFYLILFVSALVFAFSV